MAEVESPGEPLDRPLAASTEPPNIRGYPWYADLCLLTTAVTWGINIPVFKYSTIQMSPWVFNAARLVAACVTLGICCWVERAQIGPMAGRIPVLRVLLFSLLTGLFYQVVFVLGIDRTTAGNSALLMSTMPVWTAVLSYLFIRERLSWIVWVGLLVTFCGALLIVLQSRSISIAPEYFVGNLLMLSAAMIWASGTVLSRPILKTMTALQLAFVSCLVTLPAHIAIAWRDLHESWERMFAWPNWLAIAFSGILSTGIAYVTWHIGVRHLGGSHAAVYQNVVTLVAVLGGWIFLKEQPMLLQIVGGLLIVVGMLSMRRGRDVQREVQPTAHPIGTTNQPSSDGKSREQSVHGQGE